MTCTPLSAAWMAASSMAYVLPTPGAMPKKIFSRPRPGRDSSLRMEARILSAHWLSECVSENMKKGTVMVSGLNVRINLMEDRSGCK